MNTNFHKLALVPLSLHICIQQAIKDWGWEWLGNEATRTHTHTTWGEWQQDLWWGLPKTVDCQQCGEEGADQNKDLPVVFGICVMCVCVHVCCECIYIHVCLYARGFGQKTI